MNPHNSSLSFSSRIIMITFRIAQFCCCSSDYVFLCDLLIVADIIFDFSHLTSRLTLFISNTFNVSSPITHRTSFTPSALLYPLKFFAQHTIFYHYYICHIHSRDKTAASYNTAHSKGNNVWYSADNWYW